MKNTMKAWVLGGTGAVGKQLVHFLLNDKNFSEVIAVSRRETGFNNPKLKTIVLDLESEYDLPSLGGDVVFIAFGTTLRKAGSKDRQKEVDVEIPMKFLEKLKQQNVKTCVLVSSLGVSERSLVFYSRMKAELDRRVSELGFENLVLVKPSVLDGQRTEKRIGEKWSVAIGNLIGRTGWFNKYKPIKVEYVAQAMIMSLEYLDGKVTEYDSAQLHDLARIYRKEKGLN